MDHVHVHVCTCTSVVDRHTKVDIEHTRVGLIHARPNNYSSQYEYKVLVHGVGIAKSHTDGVTGLGGLAVQAHCLISTHP